MTLETPRATPAYPSAHAVAPRVRDHQASHHALAREHGHRDLGPLPDPDLVAAVIDAAFWASLRREEDYIPKISLAILPADQSPRPMLFAQPIALTPGALARLAPAVERPGIHLGVWPVGAQLFVWGVPRVIPILTLVVEAVAPGLLVVKLRGPDNAGKFINLAVLEGDQVKVVIQLSESRPDLPPLLTSLLGYDTPDSSRPAIDVLVQIAVSMRAHGRGGSLLVVPAGSDPWAESIVQPINYAVSPPFSELADLMRLNPEERRQRRWRQALGRAIEALAGLTAVDGATIITDQFELLAFGATIARRDGVSRVERVVVSEPVEGSVVATVNPAELGGTRHLSAAQFAQDQRDAVALVASQDGRFTLFAWSPVEEMVHAHRVESLLL